jgi:hypothetical protein
MACDEMGQLECVVYNRCILCSNVKYAQHKDLDVHEIFYAIEQFWDLIVIQHGNIKLAFKQLIHEPDN